MINVYLSLYLYLHLCINGRIAISGVQHCHRDSAFILTRRPNLQQYDQADPDVRIRMAISLHLLRVVHWDMLTALKVAAQVKMRPHPLGILIWISQLAKPSC